MAEYRHCTNLFTPFDAIDEHFLAALKDYKVGDPVEAEPDAERVTSPVPLAELKATGVVGIYTTLEAIMTPTARRLAGWHPNVLGRRYEGP